MNADDDDSRTVLSLGACSASPSNELRYAPGDIVDEKYKLLKLVGRGGMGVVFSATHLELHRDYALKILASGQLEGESWERFKLEAKALARLAHPGIVGIHNMGIDQGCFPYYVMDLLSGESLSELLEKQGRLPETTVISLFIEIADALKSAHAKGVIHRDLKPSNLMVLRDAGGAVTRLKLVDFGIARLSGSGKEKQSQTATGAVIGTPYYMSPEQCQGEHVDERSDIYSLGCTIYEALTGRPPFVGMNSFATFMMHQTAPIPTLLEAAPNGKFSEAIEQLLAKMLAKSPSARYQSIAQVSHDLERLSAGKPIAVKSGGGLTGEFAALGTALDAEPKFGSQEEALSQTGKGGTLALLSVLLALVVVGLVIFVVPGLTGKKLSSGLSTGVEVSGTKSGTNSGANSGTNSGAGSSSNSGTPTNKSADDNFSGLTTLDDIVAGVVDVKIFRKAGATDAEIAEAKKFNWAMAYGLEHEYNERAVKFLQGRAMIAVSTASGERVFHFPTNMRLGFISKGAASPVLAVGEIKATAAERVVLYTQKQMAGVPEILGRIGPDCLDGLECVFDEPARLRPILASWHRLKRLSFFNTYAKALPGYTNFDECKLLDKDLVWIDKLNGIEELGLCRSDVHGSEVAKMSVLKRLKCLMLKRVQGLTPLINKIAVLNNIEELWLVDEGIGDRDLEALVKVRSLKKLRIRRSNLTPASLDTFKKMPWLQEVVLDRPFSESDKEKFTREIPGCRFESVVQPAFWKTYVLDGD